MGTEYFHPNMDEDNVLSVTHRLSHVVEINVLIIGHMSHSEIASTQNIHIFMKPLGISIGKIIFQLIGMKLSFKLQMGKTYI